MLLRIRGKLSICDFRQLTLPPADPAYAWSDEKITDSTAQRAIDMYSYYRDPGAALPRDAATGQEKPPYKKILSNSPQQLGVWPGWQITAATSADGTAKSWVTGIKTFSVAMPVKPEEMRKFWLSGICQARAKPEDLEQAMSMFEEILQTLQLFPSN